LDKEERVKKLDIAALALVLVGGVNWGLVAIAEFDLVATIAGGLEFGETNWFSRTVYGLVGLAAVYEAIRLPAIVRTAPAAAHARS
jgi:uncharacterized membrane protein YuzA (DUF378 family)